MIDPQAWLRLLQEERAREIREVQRARLGQPGPARRTPTASLVRRGVGRTLGRGLVRVGIWLMVPDGPDPITSRR